MALIEVSGQTVDRLILAFYAVLFAGLNLLSYGLVRKELVNETTGIGSTIITSILLILTLYIWVVVLDKVNRRFGIIGVVE